MKHEGFYTTVAQVIPTLLIVLALEFREFARSQPATRSLRNTAVRALAVMTVGEAVVLGALVLDWDGLALRLSALFVITYQLGLILGLVVSEIAARMERE
jgi:hypothetical protein